MKHLIQHESMEYAKIALATRVKPGTLAYSQPWTYVYRPDGECVGVMIDLDESTRATISVVDMQADVEGHKKTLAKLRPGPGANAAQRANWREHLADLTL